MADVVVDDRVAQRGGDVVLADQLAEALRSVLPVQAGHGLTVPAALRPTLRVEWRLARSSARRPGGTQEFPLRAASFRT